MEMTEVYVGTARPTANAIVPVLERIESELRSGLRPAQPSDAADAVVAGKTVLSPLPSSCAVVAAKRDPAELWVLVITPAPIMNCLLAATNLDIVVHEWTRDPSAPLGTTDFTDLCAIVWLEGPGAECPFAAELVGTWVPTQLEKFPWRDSDAKNMLALFMASQLVRKSFMGGTLPLCAKRLVAALKGSKVTQGWLPYILQVHGTKSVLANYKAIGAQRQGYDPLDNDELLTVSSTFKWNCARSCPICFQPLALGAILFVPKFGTQAPRAYCFGCMRAAAHGNLTRTYLFHPQPPAHFIAGAESRGVVPLFAVNVATTGEHVPIRDGAAVLPPGMTKNSTAGFFNAPQVVYAMFKVVRLEKPERGVTLLLVCEWTSLRRLLDLDEKKWAALVASVKEHEGLDLAAEKVGLQLNAPGEDGPDD
jgi:hypothetical protein